LASLVNIGLEHVTREIEVPLDQFLITFKGTVLVLDADNIIIMRSRECRKEPGMQSLMLAGTGMRPGKNGQARSLASAFSKFRQPPVLQTQVKSDEKGQIPVTFGHHVRHVLDAAENTRGVLFCHLYFV
jgi:hypothetical protein